MIAPNTDFALPASARKRQVVLVDTDPDTSSLLVPYLEARGWSVDLVSTPRRAIRCRTAAPLLLVRLEDHDPDTFELLGAFAARALTGRLVVVGRLSAGDATALGVDRVLPPESRFSTIATVLDELCPPATQQHVEEVS